MRGYTTGLLSLAAPSVAFGGLVALNALWVMPLALWLMGRETAQGSLAWLVLACFVAAGVQTVGYLMVRVRQRHQRAVTWQPEPQEESDPRTAFHQTPSHRKAERVLDSAADGEHRPALPELLDSIRHRLSVILSEARQGRWHHTTASYLELLHLNLARLVSILPPRLQEVTVAEGVRMGTGSGWSHLRLSVCPELDESSALFQHISRSTYAQSFRLLHRELARSVHEQQFDCAKVYVMCLARVIESVLCLA
jgi:hypothetical protein